MLTGWKVYHHLQPTLKWNSGPIAYSRLGVTFILEDSNIVRIDHIFQADDAMGIGEIEQLSTQQLTIIWQLISYRRGSPAMVSHRTVECCAPTIQPMRTYFATIAGRALIVAPLILPAEPKLNSAPDRLSAWLRFANDSRPPTSTTDAIRNYYMIWEDMKGRATQGDPAEKLKFLRDFVSHGQQLDSQRLVTFLSRELGVATDQYDPCNPAHQALLEGNRDWARKLVESEIDQLL